MKKFLVTIGVTASIMSLVFAIIMNATINNHTKQLEEYESQVNELVSELENEYYETNEQLNDLENEVYNMMNGDDYNITVEHEGIIYKYVNNNDGILDNLKTYVIKLIN